MKPDNSKQDTAKTERLDFRVSPDFKALAARAANLAGTNLTAFMIEAVRAQALKTIEQYERITLNNKSRDEFLAVLARPPAPNAALRKAARKYTGN
ncbi:MAG: DUF1778 domain-containing protein [Gammaproteobacteria bacterium]|nr:DUF1778 domain-containing protein [Gammaproteobacteria bacterium]